VFDPYRQMKRRRQRQRRDTVDTHDVLFGEPPKQTVRHPVKNPSRFSKLTPKPTGVSTAHKRIGVFEISSAFEFVT